MSALCAVPPPNGTDLGTSTMSSPGAARLALALLALGTVTPACTPGKRMITPTTTGTDLRNMPRGRMTPLPFPGSDLARATSRPGLDAPRGGLHPPTDPATIAASTATTIR